MKKIRLELDALNVESFTTDKQARGQGTVRGHESQAPCTVDDTCQPTGGDTGGGSGHVSCGYASVCEEGETNWDPCDGTFYKHCGG